jgi:hypothetical protein
MTGFCSATYGKVIQSRLRKFEQGDKWSFCLKGRTLCAANQENQ